jgi:hypothetical protein
MRSNFYGIKKEPHAEEAPEHVEGAVSKHARRLVQDSFASSQEVVTNLNRILRADPASD